MSDKKTLFDYEHDLIKRSKPNYIAYNIIEKNKSKIVDIDKFYNEFKKILVFVQCRHLDFSRLGNNNIRCRIKDSEKFECIKCNYLLHDEKYKEAKRSIKDGLEIIYYYPENWSC